MAVLAPTFWLGITALAKASEYTQHSILSIASINQMFDSLECLDYVVLNSLAIVSIKLRSIRGVFFFRGVLF